jgi:hypothetical protein
MIKGALSRTAFCVTKGVSGRVLIPQLKHTFYRHSTAAGFVDILVNWQLTNAKNNSLPGPISRKQLVLLFSLARFVNMPKLNTPGYLAFSKLYLYQHRHGR